MRRARVVKERPHLEPSPAARTRWVRGLLLLLLACSVTVPKSLAQSARVVLGVVRSADDQPQPNAVVYLQDQKSLEVKTYITEADGHYRFGQLNSDVDYQLWAEYKGHKSKTRSISSFDSRKEFNFDLKIDTSK
jgi:Carboxypeptidase regulatory-like domain